MSIRKTCGHLQHVYTMNLIIPTLLVANQCFTRTFGGIDRSGFRSFASASATLLPGGRSDCSFLTVLLSPNNLVTPVFLILQDKTLAVTD